MLLSKRKAGEWRERQKLSDQHTECLPLPDSFAKKLRVAPSAGELRWSKDVDECESQPWVAISNRSSLSCDVEVWYPAAPHSHLAAGPSSQFGPVFGHVSSPTGGLSPHASPRSGFGLDAVEFAAPTAFGQAALPAVGVALRVSVSRHYPHEPPRAIVMEFPLILHGPRIRKPVYPKAYKPSRGGKSNAMPAITHSSARDMHVDDTMDLQQSEPVFAMFESGKELALPCLAITLADAAPSRDDVDAARGAPTGWMPTHTLLHVLQEIRSLLDTHSGAVLGESARSWHEFKASPLCSSLRPVDETGLPPLRDWREEGVGHAATGPHSLFASTTNTTSTSTGGSVSHSPVPSHWVHLMPPTFTFGTPFHPPPLTIPFPTAPPPNASDEAFDNDMNSQGIDTLGMAATRSVSASGGENSANVAGVDAFGGGSGAMPTPSTMRGSHFS